MLIRTAASADLPAVEHLLSTSDLTTAGVADQVERFLVAEERGEIVASAGIEIYGVGALLRSVAVRPDYRNRGLAKILVHRLLDSARRAGVREVYLLTTGAGTYFERFGFVPILREFVDTGVQRSREFQDACCTSAQARRLVLSDG